MNEKERIREILRRVRQVELQSRRKVDESMVGAYHSLFKGAGIDFSEVREYQPGDDIRAIDWNVTARMDRPFLKTYTEERERTLVLAVDLSASGDFGTVAQSKRELAAEVASVLALSASRNQDKVGLLLFTDQIELYLSPKKGKQHLLRVIREILFFEPSHRETDLPFALQTLNRLLKRKAIAFVFSDFLDGTSSEEFEAILKLTGQRHDLICVEMTDPRELELPKVGIIALEDAERGEVVEIDTKNGQFRENYRQHNLERLKANAERFKRLGIDHLRLSTDRPYIRELRRFFQFRNWRR
ncbi:MAG TPA: DUF58 domain-containing protein [Opitutales bacterium]|nr:DUF58 domain-containing protein [Opitutales bacterium]